MARFPTGPNAGLRAYLLDDATELRDSMVEAFAADLELAEAAAREYGKVLDALAAGRECRLYRWELPDDHPAQYAGDPGDVLILGADDQLREVD